MGLLRRLTYSLTVAILVFSVLSLPVLSQLYGPAVYLPAYGFFSIVAGAATWSLLGRFSTDTERSLDIDRDSREPTLNPDAGEESIDVDSEIEKLKNKE